MSRCVGVRWLARDGSVTESHIAAFPAPRMNTTFTYLYPAHLSLNVYIYHHHHVLWPPAASHSPLHTNIVFLSQAFASFTSPHRLSKHNDLVSPRRSLSASHSHGFPHPHISLTKFFSPSLLPLTAFLTSHPSHPFLNNNVKPSFPFNTSTPFHPHLLHASLNTNIKQSSLNTPFPHSRLFQ